MPDSPFLIFLAAPLVVPDQEIVLKTAALLLLVRLYCSFMLQLTFPVSAVNLPHASI